MAKGKGFGGFGGGMNMQAMMKQAQKMQESMLKAQEEIAQMESTGTAGGGMVTATVTGTSTLKSIEIKPDVVDPDDIDMLQDLVVAAVNEALKAASDKSQRPDVRDYGRHRRRSGRSAVMELLHRRSNG